MTRHSDRRRDQRGFALLIVFLFAAAVALMLYQQMPRVAFESEREKEQILIDRGQQYVRGIQMYVVANKKFPTKIEDLENTNNKRYLRRRYIDPMTGKDEWRLIHMNGAGQLTDSLVQKPPNPASGGDPNNPLGASGASGASGATGATGANGAAAVPDVNAAVRQRPSDRALVQANGMGMTPPANADPNDPRYWPAITLGASGASGANGQPGAQVLPGQQQIPGQPPFPGQPPQLPGQPQFPGQQFPGQLQNGGLPGGLQPGVPGQQIPGFNTPAVNNPGSNGVAPQTPFQANGNLALPGLPGQGGNTQPGAAPNTAVGMINDMLRGQNQAPAASPSAFNNTSNMGAAGLVGVASTYTGPSIKVYKDRQKYNEWEFIFQLNNGQQQQPGAQTQAGPLSPTQQPAPGTPASGFTVKQQ
jgi:hypothetical protein